MTQETEPEIDSQSAAAVDLDTMTATKETLEDYTLRFAPRTQLHAELVAVASDIVFNKYLLKPSPKKPEFRRGMLYAINPVGFGSMLPAAGLSIILRWTRCGAAALFAPGGDHRRVGDAADPRRRDARQVLPSAHRRRDRAAMYDEDGNPSVAQLKCHVCHHMSARCACPRQAG